MLKNIKLHFELLTLHFDLQSLEDSRYFIEMKYYAIQNYLKGI